MQLVKQGETIWTILDYYKSAYINLKVSLFALHAKSSIGDCEAHNGDTLRDTRVWLLQLNTKLFILLLNNCNSSQAFAFLAQASKLHTTTWRICFRRYTFQALKNDINESTDLL